MDQNLHYHQTKLTHRCRNCEEEVNSTEWEFISMSKQEEDLIYRMHKLVGDRWGLIAGRIPGRTAEEIERFWIMRHSDGYAHKRRQLRKV
ncbi:MYB-like transcription factor TCL1 [Capsicum annuum]|uniref:MYB-like transcription factor TCL1 n=1 Tax=Capsicum annuum TaxID=4072 RepID=A0A1U8HLQ3_CAPAN|nr:MYB-like transcription factor ETC3 [Capsicum annuum]PHT74689.1 MYB-like transcription factor TCL1 [Capsicum annuum]